VDGGGRTAASGASTFRNNREGGLLAAIVCPRECVGNVSGHVGVACSCRGGGERTVAETFGEYVVVTETGI
jgi:hypothetical protein